MKKKESEVIQKIGVYCYDVKIEWLEIDGNYIDKRYENLILIGINKEQAENRTKESYNKDNGETHTYSLSSESFLPPEEVMERFHLNESAIAKILEGENIELDNWDLRGTDYFSDCELSIEELREKRAVDSETFDSDAIISKIASEYVLTPKRKEALIKSIKGLK